MITIGTRVKYVIDEVEKANFELALEHVAIAIDVTAKKYYKGRRSSKSNYKNLLREYSWLIELMAFFGINLEESIFGNYPIEGNLEPTFQDLIYHVIRCNLVHDEGIPNNFEFSDVDMITMRKDHLIFPKRLIWGLLAIVVFCPVNEDERTDDGYYLSIFQNQFHINDFWGMEDVAKHIHQKRNPIRVSLVAPSGHII